MDTCKTIRVKPWGKDQGEFVEINEEDFDASVHHVLDDPLDHDGDGKPGGSVAGYDATATKGVRNRKAKAQ